MFPRLLDRVANLFSTLYLLPPSPEYWIRPYFSAIMLCLLHHFLNVILSDVFGVALALETFAVFAAISIAFTILFDFRAIDILYTFGTTHFSTSFKV